MLIFFLGFWLESSEDRNIMYPYTAERRDILENTLPEAQEISQERGICNPRPGRLPKGNLEGRGGCIFQCILTRGSVRTFFQN